MTCIESHSIVVEDKQNHYHPLPVFVKAYLHIIQTHALNVNGGRDSTELCHLGPFIVVLQYSP